MGKGFLKSPVFLFCLAIIIILAATLVPRHKKKDIPPPPSVAEGAVLVLNSKNLDPITTLEVRFDEPAIGALDNPSTVKPLNPLVISPKIKGSFKWLSQRNGIFTPTAPWALGTTYHVSLKSGLKNADGKPMNAKLEESLSTPPFAVENIYPNGYHKDNAPSLFTMQASFNETVDPAKVGRYIRFVDADGKQVAAVISQATSTNYFPYSTVDPWSARFYTAAEGDQTAQSPPASGDSGVKFIPNRILINPAKPLPPGKDWKLVISEDMPDASGQVFTQETQEQLIGTVVPFELQEAVARNVIGSSRRIQLSFSKLFDEANFNTKNWSDWITIGNAPTNLSVSIDGSYLSISGDFALGKPYPITVKKGLPAIYDFSLGQKISTNLVFEPVAPRLYFPAFAIQQMTRGHRQIDLLDINVSNATLTVTKLDPDKLLPAVKAYENKYFKTEWNDGYEPYQQVASTNFTGQVIKEVSFTRTTPVDEQQQFALDWDNLVGAGQSGAYYLQATGDGKVGTQAIVMLSDLGVLGKQGRDSLDIFVFSYETGKFIPGVKVRVFSLKDELIAQGTTDGSGVVKLDTKSLTGKSPEWVEVRKGGDVFLTRLYQVTNNIRRHGYDFPVSWPGNPGVRPLEGAVFTERGVYLPGQEVHLKTILRKLGEKGLDSLAGKKARLMITDPRGQNIVDQEMTLNAFSSSDYSFSLSPSVPLGGYSIQVTPDEKAVDHSSVYGYFTVQEYQPNAFELTVDATPRYLTDKPVTIPVFASYYSGQPLGTQAVMRWLMNAHDFSFMPEGFTGFSFCKGLYSVNPEELGYNNSSLSLNGEENLSESGRGTFTQDIPVNQKLPMPRRVNISFEVTDINQQTVSSAVDFTKDSSAYYYGFHRPEGFVRTGEALPVRVIAVNADGTPAPLALTAKVVVKKINRTSVPVKGAGGITTYQQNIDLDEKFTGTITTLPVERVQSRWRLTEDPAGNLPPSQITFKPSEPGDYLVEISGKDPKDNPVMTVATVSVYQSDAAEGWSLENNTKLDLALENDTLRAGQVARIMVKTPVEGIALVSIERENVRRFFTVELRESNRLIEVPVTADDIPNVYVSVTLLKGTKGSLRKNPMPEFRTGYCQLTVEHPDSKLTVDVHPAEKTYQPGQDVSVDIAVSNDNGTPVTDAEVTVMAVDEGILSLTAHTVPDYYSLFYQLRPLYVISGISIPELFKEDPEQKSFDNKGFLIGGGGDEGGTMRKKFIPCPYWNANLKTDAKGHVHVRFTAPESLSRYRIVALAQDKGGKFGQNQSSIEINKPLMIESALPQFARIGDSLIARAVVKNATGAPIKATVSLRLDGLARLSKGGTEKIIDLAIGQSLPVDFPVIMTGLGEAKWVWSVKGTGSKPATKGGASQAVLKRLNSTAPASTPTDYQDSALATMNIVPAAPLLKEVHVSHTSEPVSNLLKPLNPQLLEGTGTLKVSIANSRLLELSDAVKYLLDYPYGCVEQTTSRLIPWIYAREFDGAIPSLAKPDTEIEANVQAGINRLLSMQHYSGGLTYWPGGQEPMLWASAYGGIGLALAQRNGSTVPESNMNQLAEYLRGKMAGLTDDKNSMSLSERVMALYCLSLMGKVEASWIELMTGKAKLLNNEDRALLALCILETGGQTSQAEAILRLPFNGVRDYYWFGSGVRESAMNLLAEVKLDPASKTIDRRVIEIMGARHYQGRWYNTQDNAWAVMALSQYFIAVEKGKPKKFSGSLVWGPDSRTFNLSPEAPSAREEYPTLPALANTPMNLNNPSKATVFSTVSIEAYPKDKYQPRTARGFSVTRRYEKILDDQSLAPAKDLKVGDRILITLLLEVSRPAHYVAIDDSLPAVFEAVKPGFNTQAVNGATDTDEYFIDFRELRADRGLFFANYLQPGKYTVRYLARVRAAGETFAPGTKVEEMYNPDVFGITESQQINASALK